MTGRFEHLTRTLALREPSHRRVTLRALSEFDGYALSAIAMNDAAANTRSGSLTAHRTSAPHQSARVGRRRQRVVVVAGLARLAGSRGGSPIRCNNAWYR